MAPCHHRSILAQFRMSMSFNWSSSSNSKIAGLLPLDGLAAIAHNSIEVVRFSWLTILRPRAAFREEHVKNLMENIGQVGMVELNGRQLCTARKRFVDLLCAI